MKLNKIRLRWNGNQEAQKQADEAWAKLKKARAIERMLRKTKKKKSKKRRRSPWRPKERREVDPITAQFRQIMANS